MTRLASARRGDLAVTALLAAALPTGFRDRQRGEWLSDLGELRRGERLRYLAGAAWSLPGLRRSAMRHGATSGLAGVPVTGAGTAARVLLAGLIWPVLSWILFVPVRYYALDVPGRLAGGDAEFDPKSLWPFAETPEWLTPLWVVLHFGAWAAMLGGPFLIPAVTLVGVLALTRRRRGGRAIGVAVVAAALLMGAMASLSLGLEMTSGAIAEKLNGIWAVGLLGALAVVCAIRVGDLTRRARAGLVAIGVAAMAITAWSYTTPGQSMIVWFMD